MKISVRSLITILFQLRCIRSSTTVYIYIYIYNIHESDGKRFN
jgi:hypothetical protein